MKNEYIKNVNYNQFYDRLGNLKDEQNFEVIVYYKNTSDEWVENERKESCCIYFIVDGQLYLRGNKALIPLNMDFNSKDCNACYQIGKFLKNNQKITGNEILFTCNSSLETGAKLILHKQSYSNGTCFYALKDGRGDWNVNHGSNNLQDIINQMECELNIDEETRQKECIQDNPKIKAVYDELIRWRLEVIKNLQLYLNKINIL